MTSKQTPVDCFSSSPLGLYVHVPFCATTCDFCAFVQSKPDRKQINRYLSALKSEARHCKTLTKKTVHTVFWGGGTPSILLPDDLRTLGGIVHEYWDLGDCREWTVEVAPASVTPSKLKVLKSLGVTRISMGVQSFDPATLEEMGRLHSVNQIHRAYDWIQSEGFEQVNLDLIIAFPGQNEDHLLKDLEHALALKPDHLSTYCLTFEEDTQLYAKLQKGEYKIDPEKEADLYTSVWNYLEKQGYSQYEVSNFAKPGCQSIHNLNTWKMHEWIGLGPSASSQFGGKRWTQNPDFEKWEHGIAKAQPTCIDESTLTIEDLANDILIFGLRTIEGVSLKDLGQRTGMDLGAYLPVLNQLVEEELADWHGDTIRLNLNGRLKADAIGVEILSVEA